MLIGWRADKSCSHAFGHSHSVFKSQATNHNDDFIFNWGAGYLPMQLALKSLAIEGMRCWIVIDCFYHGAMNILCLDLAI